MRLITGFTVPRPLGALLAAMQIPIASDAPLGSALRLVFEGGIAGLIYKFGVARTEMQHAKHDVAVQINQLRDESKERDARVHDRLDSIDRRLDGFQKVFGGFQDYRLGAERWQGGVDSTVTSHERRLEQLERAAVAGVAMGVVT